MTYARATSWCSATRRSTTAAGRSEGDLVKRVIALPGQTIYSSGNSIYVDGRLLAEPYLPHYDPLGPPIPDASSQHPYRVPPGEFYVLGDNRADLMRQPLLGADQGLEHRRQGGADVVARRPPRLPPVLIPDGDGRNDDRIHRYRTRGIRAG